MLYTGRLPAGPLYDAMLHTWLISGDVCLMR
jgi:hypothetical protein